MDKAVIRIEIDRQLEALSADVRRQIDQEITTRVLQLPSVQQASVLCIYESFKKEVDTKQLIATLRLQGKTIVVPPKNPKRWDTASIDVWIVPAIAFDVKGNRLGRGGGYYDRVLAKVSKPTIGIVREVQIVPRLPKEKYDIPITTVVTEKNIYEQ